MVKRQKEKLYASTREYRENRGSSQKETRVRSLPFSHCALSLNAFTTPVCNYQGIVFDASQLIAFVKEHGKDPVTGKAMTRKDIITLNMEKDNGEWQCPILGKALTDRTAVIAIVQPNNRSTANVYSKQAYQELNVKAKNYEDLVSGVKFDKKRDVLILNDPDNPEWNQRRNISQFYHIRHSRELAQGDEKSTVNQTLTGTRILEKVAKRKLATDEAFKTATKRQVASDANLRNVQKTIVVDGVEVALLASDVTGVQYTTAGSAVGLTSTSNTSSKLNEQREATPDEIIEAQCQQLRLLKEKATVILQTSHGNVSFQLHADIAPRTVLNFVQLCKEGAYNDTVFHRLIPKFMIQGGKRSENDTSYWDGTIPDEFDDRLKHDSTGVLSMANAGPGTGKRQFFVTFDACPHLDRKHSVFGKVIEGIEIVKGWENIQTDKKDVPNEDVRIRCVQVIRDPTVQAILNEGRRLEAIVRKRLSSSPSSKSQTTGDSMPTKGAVAVGKYLKVKKTSLDDTHDIDTIKAPARKQKKQASSFGNFDGW